MAQKFQYELKACIELSVDNSYHKKMLKLFHTNYRCLSPTHIELNLIRSINLNNSTFILQYCSTHGCILDMLRNSHSQLLFPIKFLESISLSRPRYSQFLCLITIYPKIAQAVHLFLFHIFYTIFIQVSNK